MTITILSREVISGGSFYSGVWKFHVSAYDAAAIIANHTTLSITTSAGVKLASNPTPPPYSGIYPSATMDPYGLGWTVLENVIGSGDWSINFIIDIGPGNNFNNINNWNNFVVTGIAVPVVVEPVNFTDTPQILTPGYNPVVYKFNSSYSNQPSHRYIVDIYKNEIDATQTLLGEYKITQQLDGSGYMDVSRVLTNFLSVDFDKESNLTIDASKSYIDYSIKVGEEMQTTWQFNSYTQYGVTGAYSNRVVLRQTPTLTSNYYVVGDQIDILSPDPFVAGLHTVLLVPNPFSIVIDINYTGTVIGSAGVTSYADGRSTLFRDVNRIDGLAFNGVRSWNDFPDWYYRNWFNTYSSGDECQLLTSLRIGYETSKEDNRFYMTPSQSIWLNIALDSPDSPNTVEWYAGNAITNYAGGSISLNDVGYSGTVKQFKICPVDLIGSSPYFNQIDRITFIVFDDNDTGITSPYTVYLDTRCKIEEYELYFMDRMGSILSFACQLRATENGTITRESFKKQVTYNENSSSYRDVYDTADVGTSVSSVNLIKDLTLNTNWMNNEMSLLFEELLTSPYVWLKTVIPATELQPERVIYNSVVVNETSFEVEKQKNKRLIKKTLTVKYANENIINI